MKREVRSKSVGTKVSEAELRVLESRAEQAGVTLSEWVRDVLLGSSIETGTLAAERAMLPPQRPGPVAGDPGAPAEVSAIGDESVAETSHATARAGARPIPGGSFATR